MSKQDRLDPTPFLVRAEEALAEGKTLPFSLMARPDIHAFEQSCVFRQSWQAICPSALLVKAGHRFITNIGDVPCIILRADGGELRGFVNACRHRAFPVAQENGSRRLLTCRYHGWTYDLDGQLVRAPEAEDQLGSERDKIALLPVSVAEWRGCVFANADAQAPPLLDALPDLESAAANADFDLSAYRPAGHSRLEIASDWKLVYDNVVECYHCPTMHATSLNTLYEADGFVDIHWVGKVRHAEAQLKDGGGSHHCIQIFPGSYLVQDAVMGIVGRFCPAAPGKTMLEFHFLAAPDVNDEKAQHFITMWKQTLEEDSAIVEAQQDVIRCGKIVQGRLIEGPETSVIGVQRLILEAYRQAARNS